MSVTLHRTLCQLASRLSFLSLAFPARGENWPRWLLAWGLLFSGASRGAVAQDWPQILGPNRDGHAAAGPALADAWSQPPRIAWQVELGSGYSGPAIADGRVLAFHRVGNEEIIEALELASGRQVWRTSWPASYRGGVDADHGPRCVPTVAGEHVICYGAAGDLAAVDLASGQLQWQRPLRSEYDADDGYFGAGSTPLVMGQTIVVGVGGKQAGVVGIDLLSGKTRWTATNYDASYAPPVAVDQHTALVVTRLHTLLIDVRDGRVLSEMPFGSRGPTVNAAAPIAVGDNRYLLTANYGVGASLVRIAGGQLESLLRGSDLVSSQYITPVAVGSRVIAVDGRDDGPPSALRSLDLDAQRVVWEQPEFGTAQLIAVGQRVIALTVAGEVRLLDATAPQYRELGRMSLPTGTYRAPPALAGRWLVVRDTRSSPPGSRYLCLALPLAP